MDTLFYKTVRPIVKGLIYILFRPKVEGVENIPKTGPLVLAGNHTKWLDPVMLVGVTGKRQVHFLAKIELFSGITKPIVKGMGAIPVNRKIHDKGALSSAIDALNNGECIGIFPEGTINRTEDVIMPFKMGAVKMSHETNANLVPFIITGKYKLFGKSLTVKFMEPIKIGENLEEENERLMSIIREELVRSEVKNGNKKER